VAKPVKPIPIVGVLADHKGNRIRAVEPEKASECHFEPLWLVCIYSKVKGIDISRNFLFR
jgi:hypothetical protein